jgi:cell division transport system permease protein
MSENLYLTLVGAGVIAAATLLMGTFALLLTNLEAVVATWNQDAHVSAYFLPGTAPETQFSMQQAVASRPEVELVEHMTSEEAAIWMKEQMPELKPVLEDLGSDPLPASLEITLKKEFLTAEEVERFARSLSDGGAFADVDYGRDWVGRFDAFLSVATGFGAILAICTALGTLFLVANTVHLAVYARQDELEIMRLVGATPGYILAPFAIEGAAQGFLGGLVALIALMGLHQGLEARLVALIPVALGQAKLVALPITIQLGLLSGGVLGGAGVNSLAAFRFLRRLP